MIIGGVHGPSNVDFFNLHKGIWSNKVLDYNCSYCSSFLVTDLAIMSGDMTSNVLVYNTTSTSFIVRKNALSRTFYTVSQAGASTDKVGLFAGGSYFTASSIVDIFNYALQSWTTSSLSISRAFVNVITVGIFIVVAGGRNDSVTYNRVDIYNTLLNSWSTTSSPSTFANSITAAAIGCKAVFIAGFCTTSPCIPGLYFLDLSSFSWSSTFLNSYSASGIIVSIRSMILVFRYNSNKANYITLCHIGTVLFFILF